MKNNFHIWSYLHQAALIAQRDKYIHCQNLNGERVLCKTAQDEKKTFGNCERCVWSIYEQMADPADKTTAYPCDNWSIFHYGKKMSDMRHSVMVGQAEAFRRKRIQMLTNAIHFYQNYQILIKVTRNEMMISQAITEMRYIRYLEIVIDPPPPMVTLNVGKKLHQLREMIDPHNNIKIERPWSTGVHVKKITDFLFEARCGIINGESIDNPFDESFSGRYVSGTGATEDEAIDAMLNNMVPPPVRKKRKNFSGCRHNSSQIGSDACLVAS